MNARLAAARVVHAVAQQGRSLATALPPVLAAIADRRERSLAQELAYGTVRWYLQLQAIANALLKHPLKRKDRDVYALLLVGLYQLRALEMAPHAAVNETVQAVRSLGKPWAAGLANGVLRNFSRRQAELEANLQRDPVQALAHPTWLLEQMRQDWPQHWQALAHANNQRPPMTLRVNAGQTDTVTYQQRLQAAGMPADVVPHAPQALRLQQAVPVEQLPDFAAGAVSVQDAAAQLAAPLLQVEAGMRVLDACAAPGGKTAHLLECTPDSAGITALELDASRLERLRDTLARQPREARVLQGDAGDPGSWWDGQVFDRILLDAPCSATGVIRRHPDIKLLRRAADLEGLAAGQSRMLAALWPLLAPGGILLYATCSILKRENSMQVAAFLEQQKDARDLPITAAWGHACGYGRQILTGEEEMDGFYYASLGKV